MTVAQILQNWQVADDQTLTAYSFGFEDAVEGRDQRGSSMFLIKSREWDAYNEGYLDGLMNVDPASVPHYEERLRAAQWAVEQCGEATTLPLVLFEMEFATV